jgi:Winged helix DNA-binding domain
MVTMDADDLMRLRMASLLLDHRERRDPGDVVEWLGAMQAQDLASGEWSFGVRSTGLTQADVHRATVDRRILRTWPMRGTVHFVPPRDARWMLEVTGVRALRTAERRRKEIGLTEEIAERAARVLHDALRGGGRLTRAECVQVLVDAGVHTAPRHGYHLLWYASQIGVTCIGPQQGKEQTFVLLDEWVPDPVRLDRDDALATLALRYYRGRGPATRQDFAGWTGLTAADARRGIELAGEALTTVEIDGVVLLVTPELLDRRAALDHAPLLLLPGFDEYLLGVKDRSAMLGPGDLDRVIPGGNGVFQSTVVVDGRVVGTWRRRITRRHVHITVTPFGPLDAAHHDGLRVAAEDYATYLGTEAKVTVLEA